MVSLPRAFPLALLAATSALAQTPTPGGPPVTTDVIVTAEATPESWKTLGVAATVIDQAEIDRSKVTTALDLLRSVPGVDIVQSGGPGTVSSLFLRGTNSNQALVLVDGVKLNSPYFGGADLSGISTSNVERIEVVRGPFSALYGSEAVGGVIQIFTRRSPGKELSGSATLGLGNASTREGALSVGLSKGPVEFTGGFRRLTTAGVLANDFFAATNVSGSLSVALSTDVRAGLVVRRDDSRTGIPFDGAVPTPLRFTAHSSTTASLPVSIALGRDTALDAAAFYADDRPSYGDPSDPYGFTRSETRASRVGGRLTLSRGLGATRLSVGADWERTLVSNEDSYGLEIDGRSTRTWSLFVEDRLSLLSERLVATVGVRRDQHSAFGGATNPRMAISFRVTPGVKLRVAAGGAFRSPTTGELYYPYSGNPDLSPERSVSFEAGAEWDAGRAVTFEASLFQNDIRDLIQYDFATSSNVNVGRARTRGVELVARGAVTDRIFARASYTYLDAVDRETGGPLLRRPKHRASATVGMSFEKGASAQLTALFVGARADVDAATFARVEDPSYLRLDLAVTGPRFFDLVSPFVRVANLLGLDYVEAAGFPSPGRRYLAGLEVGF